MLLFFLYWYAVTYKVLIIFNLSVKLEYYLGKIKINRITLPMIYLIYIFIYIVACIYNPYKIGLPFWIMLGNGLTRRGKVKEKITLM